MINQRIFSANVGEPSTGNKGPDAIEQDIDNLLANDQELLGITGSKANLTTDDKTNLVAAINEHETQINTLAPHPDKLVTDVGGVHGLEIEKGTWTPTLQSFLGTYTKRLGKYIKIGNKVFIEGIIELSDIGTTDTGLILRVTQLPFTLSTDVSQSFTIGKLSKINWVDSKFKIITLRGDTLSRLGFYGHRDVSEQYPDGGLTIQYVYSDTKLQFSGSYIID